MVENKNKNIWKYCVSLFFGCAVFFIFAVFSATPAKAVTISQLNVEINARPGETIEQVVQLYDETMTGATVYPVVYNFTEDPNREGAVQILTDPADLKPDHLWIKWGAVEDADEDTEQILGQEDFPIVLPAEGTLVDFPYQIEIPQDAEPGTHLISLVFQLKPTEQIDTEGVAVYIGANVATNIFLKVLGTTIDDIEVELQSGVFTNKDPKLSVGERKESFHLENFFFKAPVDFLVTVNNKGSTHQKPDGRIIIINDLLGSQPEQILVNEENKIILPGTDRTFEVSDFGQGFMFGKYRAKIELLYGNPLKAVEKEIVFWIVPVVEILIALGVILLLIVIIVVTGKIRKKGKVKKELEREKRLRQQIVEEIKGKKQPSAGKKQKKGKNKQKK